MWARGMRNTKHNIIFDTNGMYNDMFNDIDSTLLNNDDEEIMYYTYKFIGLLVHDSKDISLKLFKLLAIKNSLFSPKYLP